MNYRQLIIISILIALLGYGTYVLYPRFSLTEASGLSLFVLSIAAGFASFFSPCSFSLMIALIGRFSKSNGQTSVHTCLRTAMTIAIGASLFFIITGLILVMGGDAIFNSITFDSLVGRMIRLITGSILITFGLMQLGKFPNPLTAVTRIASPLMRFQARRRRENPNLGMIIFGFAYPMAGFG